jgi:DNA-binding MarR family transcriptional regulator
MAYETRQGIRRKPYSFDRRERLPLSDRQLMVLNHIGDEPTHVSVLAAATGLSRSSVVAIVSSLSLRGLVRPNAHSRGWVRI